jgi:nucleoside recognition membrane protein YjiH
VSYVVAFVCGQTLHRGAPYWLVFRVAGAVAFAGYSFAQVPNAIWWGRPWKSVLKEVADGIVYALLTAGTFGWLWPEV